jgi:membrane protease YdiL (CAAX protease family)
MSNLRIKLGFIINKTTLNDILFGIAIIILSYLIGLLVLWKFDSVVLSLFNYPFLHFLKDFGTHSSTAIFEEIIFRSLLLTWLVYIFKNKKLIALILSSLLFGVLHTFNEPSFLLTLLSHSLGGLLYGYAFIATSSVFSSIALHFSWNMMQSIIYGFGFIFINKLPWINGIEGGYINIIIRLVAIFLFFTYIRIASIREKI